jgi:hypothetical protein
MAEQEVNGVENVVNISDEHDDVQGRTHLLFRQFQELLLTAKTVPNEAVDQACINIRSPAPVMDSDTQVRPDAYTMLPKSQPNSVRRPWWT